LANLGFFSLVFLEIHGPCRAKVFNLIKKDNLVDYRAVNDFLIRQSNAQGLSLLTKRRSVDYQYD